MSSSSSFETPQVYYKQNRKRLTNVAWDLILLLLITIIIILYVLCFRYANELYDMCHGLYNMGRICIQRTKQAFASYFAGSRVKFLPIRAVPPSLIYAPHYHLSMKHGKEKLCTKNCYQNLFEFSQSRDSMISNLHHLPFRERWGLELALKLDFDSIWYLAIRNVHVYLLQHIFLWCENNIKCAYQFSKKRNWQRKLDSLVQQAFEHIFCSGNYYFQQVHDVLKQDQPITTKELLIRYLVPEDSWFVSVDSKLSYGSSLDQTQHSYRR